MSYKDIEKLDKDQLLHWKERIEKRIAEYEEGEKKVVWQVGTASYAFKEFKEDQFLEALEYLNKVPYENSAWNEPTIDVVNEFIKDRKYFRGVKSVMPEIRAKLVSAKEYEELFKDEH